MSRGNLIAGGVGTILVLLEVWYLLGTDRAPPLQPAAAVSNGRVADTSTSAPASKLANDTQSDLVATVLADTVDTWSPIFKQVGFTYEPPKLVPFSGAVQPACAFSQPVTGPFYCPADRKVYIDLDFFRELRERYPAPGDIAVAYVVAHEIGHHVQNLMGTADTVEKLLETATPEEAVTVTLIAELQADCYAGIWVNHSERARHILEQGDVEAALTAATAIGKDRLAEQSPRHVVPDSFTYGTAGQRLRWFRTGLSTGDLLSCETFTTPDL